jgi:hypothetical protein
MSRNPAVRTLALFLLLPVATARAQAPAAAPAPERPVSAANQTELRLEQRLLSLDLVAYKETRQREGLARQKVTEVLGRLDQALASDTVALGTLEGLQDELAVARGAAHTAEDRLNAQLDRLGERMRRIALLETDTGAPLHADALTGRWRVTIQPQNLTATFELRLDGTVVGGSYLVNGSTGGSFRGTLADGRLHMQRLDSKGGFDSTWDGIVGTGRIVGTWTTNELATGSPNRGEWTAVRDNGS